MADNDPDLISSKKQLTIKFPIDKSTKKPILTWKGRTTESFTINLPSSLTSIEINPAKIYDIQHSNPKKTGHGYIQTTLLSNQPNISIPPSNAQIISKFKEFQWTNKIIHGDSLMGMASLIDQGFIEQVQMVYMDPPFGIEFNAKFSIGGQKSEGYLDSWENGLGSYLDYLRKRLVLLQKLLTRSGSIFIQIGDENVHYVRCLMDEIFGKENFVKMITFRTAISTNNISSIADYLLWYAKDKSQIFQRRLFKKRPKGKSLKTFTYEYEDDESGKKIAFKPQELVKRVVGGKKPQESRYYPVYYNGKEYFPPKGFEWRWDKEALQRLVSLKRVYVINGKLYGMRFEKDFPAMILTNVWTDTSTSTFAARKHYSVHTNPKVIRRCIAMTTKPGDLVLDPTLGSGTTAIVAENYGRRWIGFDTSPTAILSTINWLLGKKYHQYQWNSMKEDFKYIPVQKISLSRLANNRACPSEPWYDKPKIKKRKAQICSPFTLEFLSTSQSQKKSQYLLTLLTQNGLLSPDGQNIPLKDIEIIPKKHSLHPCVLEFKGTIENQNTEIFYFSDQDPQEKKNFLVKLKKYKEEHPQQLIIILNDVFSLGFLQNFLRFNNYPSLGSIQAPVLYGIMHPDLNVDELDFSKHGEAFRLIGICGVKISKFFLKHFDFSTRKFIEQKVENVSLWGVLDQPTKTSHQWYNLGQLNQVYLDFYQKYMDKSLNHIWGKSPFDVENWKEIRSNSKEFADPVLFIIDHRGCPYIGILNHE